MSKIIKTIILLTPFILLNACGNPAPLDRKAFDKIAEILAVKSFVMNGKQLSPYEIYDVYDASFNEAGYSYSATLKYFADNVEISPLNEQTFQYSMFIVIPAFSAIEKHEQISAYYSGSDLENAKKIVDKINAFNDAYKREESERQARNMAAKDAHIQEFKQSGVGTQSSAPVISTPTPKSKLEQVSVTGLVNAGTSDTEIADQNNDKNSVGFQNSSDIAQRIFQKCHDGGICKVTGMAENTSFGYVLKEVISVEGIN